MSDPKSNGKSRTEPIVQLVNVHKQFDNHVVLDGIDLTLYKGQTTVVLGESGTGKSVLIKHIVRLLQPDAGEVYYRNRRIDNLSERELASIRPRFGFLFQLSALFDSMNVGDNIAFPLREHTTKGRGEIEEIVAKKLTMVGLEGIESKMPSELSGGQLKRVALARAIALDPEVILYDEPTTGLDPPRADVINELILKLQRELGVTSVVVTHDIVSARKVADRIIMLHEGKLIYDGTPETICSADDQRVRRFIEGRCDEAFLQPVKTVA